MKSVFFLAILLSVGGYGYGQNPVSHPAASWSLNDIFSDEFNTSQLDLVKWNNDVNDWGTWSWEPDNAYISYDSTLADSVLTLRMVQKSHTRNNKQFYFTSGICRNRETFTYGYFEAKIKASAKGQGTCPAFWMFSVGQPTPTEEGGVKYCEIDAVEIFQVPNQLQRLEMNLHTRIIKDGVLTWIRPGQGYTALTHNTWVAPWDPRNDYHTYGVLSRVDSIFWYVDGIQRGAKKNHYWHLPMYLTVSMGLRTPYEKYINGVRTIMPFPDSIPEAGFPTEMYCDYVRVWNTEPQLYADREEYYNAQFPINNDLEFDCRYFAGNGDSVISAGFNGMTCKLQEIQSDGTVVNEYVQVDNSIVGGESGETSFVFSLLGVPPSSALPAGNAYILKPAFRSSFNGGADVFLEDEYYPVELVQNTSIFDQEARSKIQVFNREESIHVNLSSGIVGNAKVSVYDLSGRIVYHSNNNQKNLIIDNTMLPAGIYVISVKADNLQRVEKVAIRGNR